MPRLRPSRTSRTTATTPTSALASIAPALAIERPRLPSEVARRIVAELQQGRWTNYLPGERKLAEMLQVSRTSLRPALAELEKQGWLRTAHGCRRAIIGKPGRGQAKPLGKTIVVLSPRSLENMDPFIVFQLESLRELLTRRGMTLSIEVRPACYETDATGTLARLVSEVEASVWLLWLSTQSMQEWFLAKGVAHIVFGSAFHPTPASRSTSTTLPPGATPPSP